MTQAVCGWHRQSVDGTGHVWMAQVVYGLDRPCEWHRHVDDMTVFGWHRPCVNGTGCVWMQGKLPGKSARGLNDTFSWQPPLDVLPKY